MRSPLNTPRWRGLSTHSPEEVNDLLIRKLLSKELKAQVCDATKLIRELSLVTQPYANFYKELSDTKYIFILKFPLGGRALWQSQWLHPFMHYFFVKSDTASFYQVIIPVQVYLPFFGNDQLQKIQHILSV